MMIKRLTFDVDSNGAVRAVWLDSVNISSAVEEFLVKSSECGSGDTLGDAMIRLWPDFE